MQIRTIPTANKPIAILQVPTGDFSLDTGLRLLIEMKNGDGIIIDKTYLEIPQLPNFIVDGQEVESQNYLKYLTLQRVGLLENLDQPGEVPPVPTPNWQGALNQIRGTTLFGKIYNLACTTPTINTAFTLILSTLNAVNPAIADLNFGLEVLKAEMGASLTEDDIDFINQVLQNNNFPFQI